MPKKLVLKNQLSACILSSLSTLRVIFLSLSITSSSSILESIVKALFLRIAKNSKISPNCTFKISSFLIFTLLNELKNAIATSAFPSIKCGDTFPLKKYPNSKVFGITTGMAVMKINYELGYKPVHFSELTDDPDFWKGCQTCKNYDVLTRTNRKMCLCTGMLYDPKNKKYEK